MLSASMEQTKPTVFNLEILAYIAVYLGTAAVWMVLYLEGREYYGLGLEERPYHEMHKLLKPGGTIGHGLGFAGTAMMIAAHAYTLRKRFRWFEWMGSPSGNLHLHIYLGIAGPMFVVLHTAFKFNGLVALSFWCMVIVMLSGFVGRYFYGAIPRILSGLAAGLSDAEKLLESMENGPQAGKGMDCQAFEDLQRKINRLQRKASLWNTLQNRLHYWHLFHKPFSIIMYGILAVHVIMAWRFGHHWIF